MLNIDQTIEQELRAFAERKRVNADLLASWAVTSFMYSNESILPHELRKQMSWIKILANKECS